MQIGTWNVCTLKKGLKLEEICREMERNNLDILGLAEIRWRDAGEEEVKKGYHLLYSGNSGKNYGVGILIKHEAYKSLHDFQPVSDRIITANFKTNKGNLTIIQCYAPTNVTECEEKDKFYLSLNEAMKSERTSNIIIVAGDLNARVGTDNTGFESVMGKYGVDGKCSDNGNRLKNFAQNHNLYIGGTGFQHAADNKYTYVQKRGRTRDQLDHILISRAQLDLLVDVCNRPKADIYTDHLLLVAELQRIALCTIERNDLKELKEHRTTVDYVCKLKEAIAASINSKELKSSFSAETWKHIDKRQERKDLLENTKCPEEYKKWKAEYNALQKKINKLAEKDEIKYNAARALAITDDQVNVQRKDFRTHCCGYKNLRDAQPNATPLKNNGKNKLHGEAGAVNGHLHVNAIVNTASPTEQELKTVIMALKNNEPCSADDEIIQILQQNLDKLLPSLLSDFAEIWTTWMLTKTSMETETHSRTPREQRNTIQRIVVAVIHQRIAPTLHNSLRAEQRGFGAHATCIDNIVTVRHTIEQSQIRKLPLFLLYVHFAKPYETISRAAIWKRLQFYGIPEEFATLIKALYADYSAVGTHADCELSHLLYALVLDGVLANCNLDVSEGIELSNGQILGDLEYGDDICLLAQTHAGIEVKFQKLLEHADKVGLELDLGKTKVMRINTETLQKVKVTVKGKIRNIADVEQHHYLGHLLAKADSTKIDAAAAERIGIARCTFKEWMPVFKTTDLTEIEKLEIFNKRIKPLLLYGSETWKLTKNTMDRLEYFVKKSLCTIFQLTSVSASELWQHTACKPIRKEIREQFRLWLEELRRRSAKDDLVLLALQWQPTDRGESRAQRARQ